MTREEILGSIQQLVRTQLDHDGPVDLASELAGDLRLDSIKQLTLVVELENEFRITIEPEDEAELLTVGHVVSLIERRLAQGRTTA